ncbi:MAG: putative endonuclease lcl3 [Claussenomyces sp. TS43310]|nr:MAG: putative endonuclease lcl3 [Claussenomyces sp. TS43310]
MRWPTRFLDSNKDADDKRSSVSWADNLNATNWSHYTEPRTLIPTFLLTTTIILSFGFYRSYLRRIPVAGYIQPSAYGKRSLFGTVTRVGDGDNFHLFHTPGGRLAGWGWLRMVPEWTREQKRTIAIRIAGIDAPEAAHFGKVAQPHSAEALQWLKNYIINRRVRAYVYRRDQYDRIVARVSVRRFFLRRDVGLEMLKAGLATIYEAKSGAEFGDLEDQYRAAEAMAKLKKRGIWSESLSTFETPREYKTRMTLEEEERMTKSTKGTSSPSLGLTWWFSRKS